MGYIISNASNTYQHHHRKARWVLDGKFWTASGVSAGTDLSLAVVREIYGRDLAKQAKSAQSRLLYIRGI